MSTQPFHKHDERDDLLALGSDVMASPASSSLAVLTARDAARALVGVAGWVSRRVGVDGMQERMGMLVRHAGAWTAEGCLHDIPVQYDGRVDEHLALIAVVASGLWTLFGPSKLRSAMAFWATERDSAVWQQLAA